MKREETREGGVSGRLLIFVSGWVCVEGRDTGLLSEILNESVNTAIRFTGLITAGSKGH